WCVLMAVCVCVVLVVCAPLVTEWWAVLSSASSISRLPDAPWLERSLRPGPALGSGARCGPSQMERFRTKNNIGVRRDPAKEAVQREGTQLAYTHSARTTAI